MKTYASRVFEYLMSIEQNGIAVATFTEIQSGASIGKNGVSIGLKDLHKHKVIEKVSNSHYRLLIREVPMAIQSFSRKVDFSFR